MDKKEMLKKYWFVALVAVGLFVFLLVFVVQSIKDQPEYVKSKQVEGKDVVYTLNGEDYLADDFYNDMYDEYVMNATYFSWSKSVIDKAIKTTDELANYATNYAAYIAQNNDQTTIDNYLKQNGYPNGFEDLNKYALDMLKADQLYYDFYVKNFDKYGSYVVESYQPKKISHILIKIENIEESVDENGNKTLVAKPNDEEKAKLDAVLNDLKTKDWNEVAKEYTDEEANKDNGGYLGIYDNNSAPSQFVKEFSDAVLAQDYGTVSKPVVSEFGYHIIKIEKPTDDELKADKAFISEFSSFYSYPNVLAVKEKADELGFKVVDEGFKEKLERYQKNAEDEMENIKASLNEESESEVTE